MCTVPLVLTNQIQACTPAPNILRWYLLFPWYWPFKFKHAYTHQKLYVNVICSLGTDNVDVYCSFGTILSIQACIYLDAPLWQPKSHCINITIKINCISATTLNTDMLSKSHTKSHPIKKVGFFCYRCGRDDFGFALALALAVLASNCKQFLPPELPQAKFVALPGQIVVTHPDFSSSHNEQLVACSIRLPRNVPHISFKYIWRKIPCDSSFQNNEI
jgi:hypothetical protein